ncbi:hypothetical protein VNO77_11502 [Canavalia gladiata]|uniref:Uncharacterized protein n=1 Tax=Canavalia gladiata TaxID=3824 RepID=A0AAN9QYA2_CANGL
MERRHSSASHFPGMRFTRGFSPATCALHPVSNKSPIWMKTPVDARLLKNQDSKTIHVQGENENSKNNNTMMIGRATRDAKSC